MICKKFQNYFLEYQFYTFKQNVKSLKINKQIQKLTLKDVMNKHEKTHTKLALKDDINEH